MFSNNIDFPYFILTICTDSHILCKYLGKILKYIFNLNHHLTF